MALVLSKHFLYLQHIWSLLKNSAHDMCSPARIFFLYTYIVKHSEAFRKIAGVARRALCPLNLVCISCWYMSSQACLCISCKPEVKAFSSVTTVVIKIRKLTRRHVYPLILTCSCSWPDDPTPR